MSVFIRMIKWKLPKVKIFLLFFNKFRTQMNPGKMGFAFHRAGTD
jgi:hypothetical protein